MPSPSLFSKLVTGTARVVGGLWTRWGGQGWSKIRTFLPSARIDWETEAGNAWQNSIVALAISWLGDRFPRPMVNLSKIARDGDYVPVGHHPIVDLWKRPNAFYGRRTMEKAIGLSLKVDGNAYIHKIRNRMDQVVELWWIPHFQILPTWPLDGSVYQDGYFVRVDGDTYQSTWDIHHKSDCVYVAAQEHVARVTDVIRSAQSKPEPYQQIRYSDLIDLWLTD